MAYGGLFELLFGAVDVEERRQTQHQTPPGPRADAVQLPHVPLDAPDRYVLHLQQFRKQQIPLIHFFFSIRYSIIQ